ncbi:Dynein heavy chain [Phytophthora megakarya]|uniref:Dynein heavy chain n=1 Tax=Phytophthora megakarya TaxID=4795 RepID=A0A225WMZ8_9STRA|nr:Dynein heavy chain [Phytophthora megakarya]
MIFSFGILNSIPSTADAFVNIVMGVLTDNYDWRVSDDIKENIVLMKEGVLSLEGVVTLFEGEIDSKTARLSQVILDSIAPLNRNANMLLETLNHPKLSTTTTPMSEALSYIQAQEDTLSQLVEESKMLAMFQTPLKQTVS